MKSRREGEIDVILILVIEWCNVDVLRQFTVARPTQDLVQFIVYPISPRRGLLVYPISPRRGLLVYPICPRRGLLVYPISRRRGLLVYPISPRRGLLVYPISRRRGLGPKRENHICFKFISKTASIPYLGIGCYPCSKPIVMHRLLLL